MFSNPIGIKSFEDRLHKKPMFFNPYTFGGGSVGGWVELGRTTLGSAAASMSVASLSDKRYYMILYNAFTSGTTDPHCRLNSDTGSNYAYRYSINGAADGTGVSATRGLIQAGGSRTTPDFAVGYLSNLSANEKLWQDNYVSQNTAGAGTAPDRAEIVWKHAQTSNPVNEIAPFSNGSNWDSGSEVVVLGWDPADTHTTNFWEELGGETLTSSGDTLTSGTISAKKYLWVQVYTPNTGGNVNNLLRFNSDSASNYAVRVTDDGSVDSTYTSNSSAIAHEFATATPSFYNFFIINNSANEKLLTWHHIMQNTAGAGTAPRRQEGASKWANTSSQITDVTMTNSDSGSYAIGATIKVWGSD